MIIKVGKTYRCRDDSLVKIVDMDEESYFPFKGNNGDKYTKSGTKYAYCETRQDIISEYIILDEPTITYPCLRISKNNNTIFEFYSKKHGKCVWDMHNLLGKEFRGLKHITESGWWFQVPEDHEYFKQGATNTEEDTSTRGNGGSTSYYNLPEDATQLGHLIKHKKMEHSIGEAFCALYRLNDNGEYKRNLTKALYYIQEELNYVSKNEEE